MNRLLRLMLAWFLGCALRWSQPAPQPRMSPCHAQPLLALLRELQVKGALLGFRLSPDYPMIVGWLADAGSVAAVDDLPGVVAVLPAAEAPTCLQRYEEGLEAQVASLHAPRPEPSDGAATDPRITAYAPYYGFDMAPACSSRRQPQAMKTAITPFIHFYKMGISL